MQQFNEEITSAFPNEYIPTGSSIEINKSERIDSFSHIAKEKFNFNKNILPLHECDISSLLLQSILKTKNDTYLIEENLKKRIPEEMLECDVFVRMPPIKEYTIRVKIKSVEEAIPCIVVP